MSSVIIAGDTSGTVTLAAPAVAGTTTLTLPATTGNIVTDTATQTLTNKTLTGATITVASTAAPTFSAYSNAQTGAITSGVVTKLLFQTEEWDTNSNYNNSTSVFTPTVAGYYQVNAALQGAGSVNQAQIVLYKNGSGARNGNYVINQANAVIPVLSALVYMNGTTDYLEVYGYLTGTGLTFYFGTPQTHFQAFLARSA